MSYLISNVPYFKVWVRKEFTAGHQKYHGEFIHGLVVAVNCIPDRSLSFQIIFTGCEDLENNVHGGAMWARMPIQGLMADIPVDEWPERMENHLCQPWDCMSHHHSVISIDRASSSPWYAKIDGKFYLAKYIFTVDYTEHEIADSPDQHKQSHVLYLTEGNSEIEFIVYPEDIRKKIIPQKGNILLFDGKTFHRVVESKKERISLAFNFKVYL